MLLLQGQSGPKKRPYASWSDYGGSADSMQYSALTQINKGNVNRLEQAWFYPAPGPSGRFAFSPIIVDSVMYVVGKDNAVVALDARTGKEIWVHPLEGTPTNRGFNYWESKDRNDRRLIFAVGGFLQQINAVTGVTVNSFGKDGKVDLREGIPRARGIQSGTPGRVFENLIILGSAVGEGYGSAPGDLRAFDLLTGKLVWTFHTIPHPGEFGYDTWPPGAIEYAGGVNTWGEISVDEKRGIAYFPLGSPSFDLYGGDRKGVNLFGNCLLALDARTGKRLWHFQTVHHDLWDYDLTTAPKLLTVRHEGKKVDIVAQATKFGLLYVFDRVTGEPLWPIEERPVPKSDVPGEESWPTQPFPTKPPPFARLKLTEEDINPYLDAEERNRLREIVRNARNEGIFTPPSHTRNAITIPGELGGSNWGGSAADPTTGMIYVRSADQPAMRMLREFRPGEREFRGGSLEDRGQAVYLQHCEPCHGEAAVGGIRSFDRTTTIVLKALGYDRVRGVIRTGQGQMPAMSEDMLSSSALDSLMAYLANPGAASQASVSTRPPPPPGPQGITRYTGPLGSMIRAKNGLVAISPPWAQIVAYDLNEGTIKWQLPIGTVPALAAKGITTTGNGLRIHRNGPVVTAGGLLFIGTYGDRTVRGLDKDTGRSLWERKIAGNPEGLAATYEVDGRQYLVFYASGSGPQDPGNISFEAGKPEAQGYYVFALQQEAPATKKGAGGAAGKGKKR
jgi:quinoprotein glucose dehydrogenase